MKYFTWRNAPQWIATAHAESVTQARELLLGEVGGIDGSCCVRAKARQVISEDAPEIWVGPNAEFALTDSAEVEEQDAELSRLRAELAAANEKLCEARIFTERIAQRLGDAGFDRNTDNVHEFLDGALNRRDEMAALIEEITAIWMKYPQSMRDRIADRPDQGSGVYSTTWNPEDKQFMTHIPARLLKMCAESGYSAILAAVRKEAEEKGAAEVLEAAAMDAASGGKVKVVLVDYEHYQGRRLTTPNGKFLQISVVEASDLLELAAAKRREAKG